MSLVFIAPNRDMRPWKEAILREDSNIDVEIWPDIINDQRVQFAVIWQQPEHVIERYPNLKAISSLGAGVDHIIKDDTISPEIPVCRVVSPSLVQQMKEYVLNATLNYQRNTYMYINQMKDGIWHEHINKPAGDLPIGVMGLGSLGRPIARQLAKIGYPVFGWSNSKKDIDGVTTFNGESELDEFLKNCRVLVCLLPLTDETHSILDLDVFKKINQPGYLINVARGEHLVEEDLIYALDKGWMDGACLDVFIEEPLPEKHPFWNRSSITITPHVSSITPPQEVAGQIVDNYKRALSGMELQYTVDRDKGY